MKSRRAKGADVDTLMVQVAALTARLAEAENTIIALRTADGGTAPGNLAGRTAAKVGSRLESMVRERTRELTVLTGELHAEIRERIRTEKGLLAEKAFREAVENCLVAGIVAVDTKGRHMHVNNAFCSLTGFRREELLGTGIPYPYWHPKERRACATALRKVLKGEIAPGGLELRFMTRDGRTLDVLLHASQLTVSGKVVGSLASFHDISDRMRAESALRDSEGRFRSLVQDLPVGICIYQDGQVVFANPEQKKFLATLPSSVSSDRCLNIHPEDGAAFEALCRAGTPGNSFAKESDIRLVTRGVGDTAEEIRWMRCKAGSVQYRRRNAILLTMMDITRARELEHQMVVQEKLATIGQLSIGIAHEIRNPLSAMNIYLFALGQMLDHSMETNSGEIHRALKQMETVSSKIAAVVQRIMDFSKATPPRLGSVNMNKIIEEAVHGSLDEFRTKGIVLSEELARDLPECRSDPHLIERVLLNLIKNAVQAMESRQGPRQLEIASSAENGRIVLRVSDSGPGVPPRIRTMIFDPFFTTRKEGYGIGLSFCHRIVTEHGGSLSVGESRWGGAEFRIELPLERQGSSA